MKHKISSKLFVYFLAALLISTAVTGTLFYVLISRHITTTYKNDLMRRAKVMARIISRFYESNSTRKRNPLFAIQGLREIAAIEVWLVNEDMSVTTIQGPGIPPRMQMQGNGQGFQNGQNGQHQNHHGEGAANNERHNSNENANENFPPPLPPSPKIVKEENIEKAKLPPGADKALKNAFAGETFVTEVFNPILETRSLTVGTPVLERDGNITNVLLLHSPIVGLNEMIMQSVKIFAIAVFAAFFIAIFAGIILSLSFTKPLKQMNAAAKRLAEGDYEIQTGVKEKNELGELAASMDYLAIKLKDASEESERLEKMRREFIANVSHELRTPITVIRGSLEALIDGVVTEKDEVAEYQSQMLKETIHLQRLVNDLLELSRLQTVDFKIEQNPFDIKAVAQEAANSIQKLANEKNISIKIEKTDGEKIIVGDADRVREMFMIILENAVKFSPVGGEIKVAIGDSQIAIEDNGPGIDAEELPYIFERFKKENSNRNKEGTGLGLAIAKEIAIRHNFTLSVQSPIAADKDFPGTRFVCGI